MENTMRSLYLKYKDLIKSSSPDKLLKIVSAIEYIEVIFEITASKLFGEKAKWLIIALTQLTKCLIRSCLLIFHKIGMKTPPQLFTIKTFLSGSKSSNNSLESNQAAPISAFKLNHSNRVIRSLQNSPDVHNRDWKMNDQNLIDLNSSDDAEFDIHRNIQHVLAELLYITRPICHLTCLYFSNSSSWLQFLLPFIMDASSLLLLSNLKSISKQQKIEMRRRAYLFLNYFLRSPLYEIFSKSIVDVGLNIVDQNIPLGKYIANPIKNYIPQWRSIYNYCWSS